MTTTTTTETVPVSIHSELANQLVEAAQRLIGNTGWRWHNGNRWACVTPEVSDETRTRVGHMLIDAIDPAGAYKYEAPAQPLTIDQVSDAIDAYLELDPSDDAEESTAFIIALTLAGLGISSAPVEYSAQLINRKVG
ncbi:hypothetical protein [Mycobacteroides abscessus]|uniref:hypothetical protein n=1 Tax=Mycobacteroides abscessus TaxID=36809 RepID=UPI0009A835A6|nr:hypothetical protein [Mycobacteroides abscessus]SKT45620.1 Uncharacterised protein [Mycobacteroides abscessus subsp. bolletii]